MEKELPIVLFDRIHNEFLCDKVVNDDYEASYRATTHLIKDKGCKNIALISSIGDIRLGKFRLEGYKQALASRQALLDLNVNGVAEYLLLAMKD